MKIFQTLLAWAKRQPLAVAILLGALVRGITAWCSIGFFARDDYFHVLLPALRWLDDPQFVWEDSDIPGANLRSHLLPRLVWLLLKAAQDFGVTEPESQLRVLYLILSLYGLLLIPGLRKLASLVPTQDEQFRERVTLAATYVAALHFALPFIGARLLIEALAVPPLVWGLYLSASATAANGRSRIVLGGVLLLAACVWRYQVVTAIAGVVGVMMLDRQVSLRERLNRVMWLGLGGTAGILAWGAYDAITTGQFLGPLINNIAYNLAPPKELSRSGFFSYLGMLLALSVPPITVALANPVAFYARRWLWVSVPLATFVLFHSLVPHKEERFLVPILPLFLLLLLTAVVSLETKDWGWPSRWWRQWRWFFYSVHVAALAIVMTSTPQQNLRDVMTYLRHDANARGLLSVGPELQEFFLGDRALPSARVSADVAAVARGLLSLREQNVKVNRFVAFAPEQGRLLALLSAAGYDCSAAQVFEGYWLDRVFYRLNPKRNIRRSPVMLLSCEMPEVG